MASLVEPAGDLRYDPADNRIGATPATLTIDGIAVTAAPIVPVSVDAAGELAIPGASEVGWYRFGARPGDAGSAVLAAHIAFDGRDGVFRWLADVEPGTRIVIGYVDGTTSTFMVTDTAQYGKDELPADIFRSSGDPRVVLITCGGSFNRALRSYEDNVVVYAEPE